MIKVVLLSVLATLSAVQIAERFSSSAGELWDMYTSANGGIADPVFTVLDWQEMSLSTFRL